MNEEQIHLTADVLTNGVGLITAAGYINNEGGQAIADAAGDLMERGCGTLLIDLEGTRIINSIGVSILLEIMEKLLEEKGPSARSSTTWARSWPACTWRAAPRRSSTRGARAWSGRPPRPAAAGAGRSRPFSVL